MHAIRELENVVDVYSMGEKEKGVYELSVESVSYTHLDVYKRQSLPGAL